MGRFILVLEKLPDLSLHLFFGILVTHFIVRDGVLEVDILSNQVPCGDDVVVVHNLNEGLYS